MVVWVKTTGSDLTHMISLYVFLPLKEANKKINSSKPPEACFTKGVILRSLGLTQVFWHQKAVTQFTVTRHFYPLIELL